METIKKLYGHLEEQLHSVSIQNKDLVQLARYSCGTVESSMTELKGYIKDYKFTDTQEEIYFFKHLKPMFYCKLIYFMKLFEIETKRPQGSIKVLRRYFKKQLNGIKDFSENNRDFCKYYRSGATYIDDAYFTRQKFDLLKGLDTSYFDFDADFCTSHDYKVAMILANDELVEYLNKELSKLQQPFFSGENAQEKPRLVWTGTIVALVEFIYGVQTKGIFYDPVRKCKADIKQIASFCEWAFGVQIDNPYRIFQEMRIRKKRRTTFFADCDEALIQRMDETDDDPR